VACMLIPFFSIMSPAFMFGIWHGSGWLKRGLAHRIYGRLERGSRILGWFLHSSIRVPFLGILGVNALVHFWHIWLLYAHYFYCFYAGYEYFL